MDFLFPATFDFATTCLNEAEFQFRCGFSVPCDLFFGELVDFAAEFQFRCGFSVPCDLRGTVWSSPRTRVSIPLWIFCSLRLCGKDGLNGLNAFQFRCGFSVPCDPLVVPRHIHGRHVSIPLWIFCSLRQQYRYIYMFH